MKYKGVLDVLHNIHQYMNHPTEVLSALARCMSKHDAMFSFTLPDYKHPEGLPDALAVRLGSAIVLSNLPYLFWVYKISLTTYLSRDSVLAAHKLKNFQLNHCAHRILLIRYNLYFQKEPDHEAVGRLVLKQFRDKKLKFYVACEDSADGTNIPDDQIGDVQRLLFDGDALRLTSSEVIVDFLKIRAIFSLLGTYFHVRTIADSSWLFSIFIFFRNLHFKNHCHSALRLLTYHL